MARARDRGAGGAGRCRGRADARLAPSDAVSTGRGGRDGHPAVSVVIPTRDRWPLLATTLASALGQEAVELEVVIVDDGSASPAPAAAPVRRPSRADRPQRAARSASPAPATAASRRRAGNGSPSSTTTTSGRPRSCAASSMPPLPRRHRSPTPPSSTSPPTRDWSRSPPPPPADRLPQLLTAYNPIPAGASNVIVATDLARKVGGFDPSFGHLADWDLWVRLAAAAPAAACDEPLVGYRLHSAEHALDGRRRLRRARPLRPHARAARAGAAGADLVLPLARRRPAPRRSYARRGGDEPARRPPLPLPRRRDPRGSDPPPPRARASAPPPAPADAGAAWLRPLMPAGASARSRSRPRRLLDGQAAAAALG